MSFRMVFALDMHFSERQVITMDTYQIKTLITSMAGPRRQITKRDLERALRCRTPAYLPPDFGPDYRVVEAVDELLLRYGVTSHRFADQIVPERRREFYAELQALVAEFNEQGRAEGFYVYPPPRIDFGDQEISYEFFGQALSHRDHVKHGEAVTAVILKHSGEDNYIPEYPELHLGSELEGQELTLFQVKVIRDIAKALGMAVDDFVRQCARECGEPVPACFGLSIDTLPALVYPSLAEVLATTTRPAFVVDRLIFDRAVTLAHGPTGRGKTHWCLELATAVAAGRPAFGHFPITRSGLVVFFQGENPEAVWTGRLPAILQEYGSLDGRFIPRNYALPLDDPEALEENRKTLRWYAAKQPISLIVNETYRTSVGKLNINDGTTAAMAYRVFREIAEEIGCAVIVTSHAPKGNDNDNAGSQDLENLVPQSLLLKGKREGKRLVNVSAEQGDKNRLGSEPIPSFTMDFQPVPLADGSKGAILTGYRERAAKAEATEDGEPVAAVRRPAKQRPVAEAPPVGNGDLNAQIVERFQRGESQRQIARELHCRPATVQQAIAHNGREQAQL